MTESILTIGAILLIAGISFGVGFAAGVVIALIGASKAAEER